MPKAPSGYYAVKKGREVGVYYTWEECQAQVKGFAGAQYKKFKDLEQAKEFIYHEASHNKTPGKSSEKRDIPDGASSSRFPIPAPSFVPALENGAPIAPENSKNSDWDVIYTDGACPSNGRGGAVAGVGVWFGPGDSRNISERCPGNQTNNNAELFAIARALQTHPITKKPLEIRTDSEYSINVFNKWLPGWRRKDFTTASGTPVANAPLIRYIAALLDLRGRSGQKFRFVKVKGHSGEVGNDGADALAVSGAYKGVETAIEQDWEGLAEEVTNTIVEPDGALRKPTIGTGESLDLSLYDNPVLSQEALIREALSDSPAPTQQSSGYAPPSSADLRYLADGLISRDSILAREAMSGAEQPQLSAPRPEDKEINTQELEAYAEGLLDEDALSAENL